MFNLDIIIFVLFLMTNLVVGLFYSRGVSNIRQYAVGDRNFSTGTLVSTIVASWAGAEFFTCVVAETYRQGLYFIIPAIGDSLVILFYGYFCAHRMGEFLGNLSIAEAMGNLFGRAVSLMTVAFSIVLSLGYLAIQFQMTAKVLGVIFGSSGMNATLFSAVIIIVYSAFGGIRSVTFTDVVQFFTFVCIIPVLAMIIFDTLNEHQGVVYHISKSPSFDFSQIFDFKNDKFYEMLSVSVLFLLPGFSPMVFQRMSMAKNTSQIAKAFKISGFIGFVVLSIVIAIGVFVLSDNPNLEPDDLFSYIVGRYTYTGFKGLFAIGMMAMIMSTADSFINSVSIIFAHDLCKSTGFKWAQNEIRVAKIFSIFVGLLALLLALKFTTILKLILLSAGAYGSVVSIPFLFAVFGFRSSGTSVLIAMFAGITTFLLFEFKILSLMPILGIHVESAAPGILANIFFLFASHYLLNQPGGWVGIKDLRSFERHAEERKKNRGEIMRSILNFKFLDFCKNNTPHSNAMYHCVGFITVSSVIISMFTIDKTPENVTTLFFIFKSSLLLATYFLIFPILPQSFKSELFASVFWVVGLFYLLICVPTSLFLISGLAMLQSMLFTLNIILLLSLFRWNVGLLMILLGFYSTTFLLRMFWNVGDGLMDYKVQVLIGVSVLGMSLLASVLIMFFKPVQQGYDRIDRLFFNAERKIQDMSSEMKRLMSVKQEFLNNLTHEIRTPMHHISSGAHAIYKDWDKYTDEERKELAYMIYQGYENANQHINNILDFSQLSANKIELHKEQVNLAELSQRVLDEFKGLYLKNNDLDLVLMNYLRNPLVTCDADKIARVIMNLLKNAVQYSDRAKVVIKIENIKDKGLDAVKFSVIDNGIGIPEDEISIIFGPFIQSSYTKKISGGKGLGLALCQRVIDAHGGHIWAENNKDSSGATFIFALPLN